MGLSSVRYFPCLFIKLLCCFDGSIPVACGLILFRVGELFWWLDRDFVTTVFSLLAMVLSLGNNFAYAVVFPGG